MTKYILTGLLILSFGAQSVFAATAAKKEAAAKHARESEEQAKKIIEGAAKAQDKKAKILHVKNQLEDIAKEQKAKIDVLDRNIVTELALSHPGYLSKILEISGSKDAEMKADIPTLLEATTAYFEAKGKTAAQDLAAAANVKLETAEQALLAAESLFTKMMTTVLMRDKTQNQTIMKVISRVAKAGKGEQMVEMIEALKEAAAEQYKAEIDRKEMTAEEALNKLLDAIIKCLN